MFVRCARSRHSAPSPSVPAGRSFSPHDRVVVNVAPWTRVFGSVLASQSQVDRGRLAVACARRAHRNMVRSSGAPSDDVASAPSPRSERFPSPLTHRSLPVGFGWRNRKRGHQGQAMSAAAQRNCDARRWLLGADGDSPNAAFSWSERAAVDVTVPRAKLTRVGPDWC